jgi:ABC-type glycerol-3-phosphate transport system permease component
MQQPTKTMIRLNKLKKYMGIFFVHAIPISVAIATALPFAYVLIISFQHVYYLAGDPRLWIQQPFVLDTYEYIFKKTGMLRWMLNSFIVASSVTGIGIFLYSAAGYALYRNRFNKKINLLFGLILIGIMIPKAVTMIPTFIIAKNLHLTNSYIGLIVPPLAIPVGVFLVRQAMFSFPMELIDAAKIDGCTEFTAYIKIIMPILAPSLVVVGIYTFMDQWREFVWPLILTSSQDMRTIPVGLSTISSEFRTDYGLFMAGVIIAMIPGAIAFLLMQRQFLKGLTAGALKE